MIEAIGPLAILANTIFKWVTEPEGYHELKLERKLEKLHEAALKALNARDFAALDALTAEYRRLRDTIV
jgi:hypothetical protein